MGRTKIYIVIVIASITLFACTGKPTRPPPIQSANQTEMPAIQSPPQVFTHSGSSLTIPLKAGERVEIEVAGSNMSKAIFSIVDPYGNQIAETATRVTTQSRIDNYVAVLNLNAQEYPWHFAFIAATNGDYILHGNAVGFGFLGGIVMNQTATLKATIYPLK